MAASRYGQLKALMPKVWLQQHLQKRPRQVLFKNINHLVVSLGKNMCESKFSLLKDFFRLKRGLKNAENLAKYIQKC